MTASTGRAPLRSVSPGRAVLDTSVLIATEKGRSIDESALPDDPVLSVVTLAELQAGVLAAADSESRARRMSTLDRYSLTEVLDVTEYVAAEWARLRVHLAEHRRRVNVNDLWIAASAVAHRLPIVTQDDDFDPLDGVRGLVVVKV
ncbi:PIN domain-containing protein [Actinomycetospora sp. NBRC 106378]|uniref:PIN domain-containing protein n=1 Tax=Actinomycetospora sp. NBRC 106378 TaxID=3032208 RepID=UPI0024A5E58F|nr:PIN domain-containing protein [Actinomycetospora sp. NBRC 106378]GLZ54129.1 ribonuclease VapC5 [Actinomycetospora sp. NBRC 106378]